MRDRTRTPIIRNEDVWEYAETLVGDYKPSLLKEPAPLNVLHFLESYLGASVEYQDIYYERGSDPIAGATVFNDSLIRVFDHDGRCIRTIRVAAGTIIIDNKTVEIGNRGFEAFTGLHEGGHFTMHREVYLKNPGRISVFGKQKGGTPVVCCRKNTMFSIYECRRHLTPEQNREHQANSFAAFASMPRQTFIPLATELIQKEGYSDGILTYSDADWESEWDLEKICNQLSEIYGTSFTAVKIHLKELGMLMTYHQYEDFKAGIAAP